MQAEKREILTKVAAVTLFVNACVIIVVGVLADRDDWVSGLPVLILLASVLTIGISWSLGHLMQKSQALSSELKRLENHDKLTNVASREFFFAEMERRPSVQGVILMVDLDRFRSVNDTYGHLVGDTVLRDVATILAGNIRGEDLICRFGGEEFLIFLNRQNETTGASIGERLRAVVENRKIPIGTEEPVKVTVSIGAARMDSINDLKTAITAADQALLQAKSRGRDRIVVSWSDGDINAMEDVA
ncbi:Diguanylate cyclase DosC [Shimia sp. SK013]|uniref:GGDEF domain-containing protein n=1 Tax=Shimia sp. SK013 TaxID=1389006 RepID=UPI0006B43768|nr:GGDEF domain-containing protein [Shimia sp. SK013]KPA20085.1 Diguanylate cyclase DosC [Shimia sp. SK013]